MYVCMYIRTYVLMYVFMHLHRDLDIDVDEICTIFVTKHKSRMIQGCILYK